MESALWPYGKCEKCANKNYCAWSHDEIPNCMNNGYKNFSQIIIQTEEGDDGD